MNHEAWGDEEMRRRAAKIYAESGRMAANDRFEPDAPPGQISSTLLSLLRLQLQLLSSLKRYERDLRAIKLRIISVNVEDSGATNAGDESGRGCAFDDCQPLGSTSRFQQRPGSSQKR